MIYYLGYDKIKLLQTEGGDEVKKLLLTAIYTNSEGKKTKLNDCLVLKNYGNEIYFWDTEEISKTYVLYVADMLLKEIGLVDNRLLTVKEFTLKAKER